jgi:hypothetical protein
MKPGDAVQIHMPLSSPTDGAVGVILEYIPPIYNSNMDKFLVYLPDKGANWVFPRYTLKVVADGK